MTASDQDLRRLRLAAAHGYTGENRFYLSPEELAALTKEAQMRKETTVLKLLGDRVAVERDVRETMTPGGIHLPDSAQRAPTFGTVIWVGPGDREGSMGVQPGQRVLFERYGGIEIEQGGRKLLLLRRADLIGVVEEESRIVED